MCILYCAYVFFFKQKTAYEMRISDWSSDVCSSDLLERANQLAPDQPVILNYLGYAQIERRQNIDEALALIQKASGLKPDDPAIKDSLGWAHYVNGNVKKAIPVLEKAVQGAPDDATVNEHLGDAYWTAGRRFEAQIGRAHV